MGENALLVKFGHEKYILQLQEKGILYMNNLPYFWKIEDKELRGDPFDSVDDIKRGHKGKIKFQNGKVVDTVVNWTWGSHPPEAEKINIFCMYALRPSVGTFPVDKRNFRFGNCALVVNNPQQFIDRIASNLKNQNIRGRANLVEYVDEKYTGDFGTFKKTKRFSYQSEWRVVCYDGPGKERIISINSIKDISIIIPSSEINGKISIK